MKKIFIKFFQLILDIIDSKFKTSKTYDVYVLQQHLYNQKNAINPFNKFGRKCFSQADEDGLTIEIINRIGINNGTFLEFGIGDGTENNSLVLINLGWKGVWVGNEQLKINLPKGGNLNYLKRWVNLENVLKISKNGLELLKSISYDVISMDLDGNDFYLTEKLLKSGLRPKLFIVEYNGKFIPPLYFKTEYSDKHIWKGDDYYGCSLTTYNDLFESFNYKLICCNSWTGANAFYVKQEYSFHFPEVPKQIEDIYNPPFNHVRNMGHSKNSLKTVEVLLNQS